MTLPPDLPLEDGETIVKQGQIAFLMGLLVQHGYLVLTDRRLIFMPLSTPFVPVASSRYDVPLSQVEAAERGSFWGRLPLGMLIGCPEVRLLQKNDEPVRFRVRSASAWIQAIRELLE